MVFGLIFTVGCDNKSLIQKATQTNFHSSETFVLNFQNIGNDSVLYRDESGAVYLIKYNGFFVDTNNFTKQVIFSANK